ncbi:hypothetical protein OEZ85_012258 [Tetradesmus obliquus]|uniref:DUF218 domain-containing protein n=1 Tax=Tetradesmus obliquus TaxID=3088 RepID=A0ABY8TST2_TETOB|nr:hypothetical protein OEZ85_012258 [Tetradesmus obliquus]
MQFDAIVVLAGGLLPDGGLPVWAARRLDVARDLHMLLDRQPPILCSGGGTPHKPSIIGSNRHVLHESTAMATYLMAAGVAPADILKETASYDTVGNTYFSLAIHALPAAWSRLAVVTSHFHMPRSRALFADIYRLAGSSMFGDPHRFSLTFLSASDEGCFDDHVYSARLQKEAGSLAHWQGVAGGLRSLPELHGWLHSDHLCYAVQRQHEFGKRTIEDEKLLKSY